MINSQHEELFECVARNTQYSNQIQKVFLSCNTTKVDREKLVGDLHSYEVGMDCLVTYVKSMDVGVSSELLRDELRTTQLLILWVTTDLLNPKNLPVEYAIAKELGVPILPIVEYRETFEFLNKELKSMHGIARNDVDYKSSLKAQLEHRLVSDDLRKEIEAKAFSAQLFLGYRSKDRQQALDFMKVFHDVENFEAVSIWYDRFLHGGEDYEEEIKDVIHNCDGFILLLTPNLVAEKKFVSEVEYPCAKEAGKPIVSVEVIPVDLNYFKEYFPDAEAPVRLNDLSTLSEVFKSNIGKLAQPLMMSSEQAYLLGKAYFSSFWVEKDSDRAIKLFEVAAHDYSMWALLAANQLTDAYTHGIIDVTVDYGKALFWQKRVAYISEKMYGLNHLDTANSYNKIALIYNYKNEYVEALEWNFKALAIRERMLGKEHPDIADTYNNIALTYKGQGRSVEALSQALEWYMKALNIYVVALGEEHPHTATAFNNIAAVFDECGMFDEALKGYKKALYIKMQMLGEGHSSTANTCNNIAEVYRKQGRSVEALTWHMKAFDIYAVTLGKEHPYTAIVCNNIALDHEKQGEYDKALEWFKKALVIREKIFGLDHEFTKDVRDSINRLPKTK